MEGVRRAGRLRGRGGGRSGGPCRDQFHYEGTVGLRRKDRNNGGAEENRGLVAAGRVRVGGTGRNVGHSDRLPTAEFVEGQDQEDDCYTLVTTKLKGTAEKPRESVLL